MQRLIEGVHKFQKDVFGNYRKLFRKLSQEGQNAVADSGLLPGPPEFIQIALKRLSR